MVVYVHLGKKKYFRGGREIGFFGLGAGKAKSAKTRGVGVIPIKTKS